MNNNNNNNNGKHYDWSGAESSSPPARSGQGQNIRNIR